MSGIDMIKEIIENELIDIYFQPIVSIRTKKIIAFEALTRCTYKGENIRPDLLFVYAKKEKMILELDIYTRELAIKKFHEYFLKDNNLMLFLNFESSLINESGKMDDFDSFIDVIKELKIPFENFMLEIKEDEIPNTKALKNFCKRYKKMGFYIALDDFGTGSSTFDRINLIKPHLIKIDKSLFNNLVNNQINREILKAIAKMSHNLGIRVLAEGVETKDSICVSLKSGINLFQGYYFCKPTNSFNDNLLDDILNKTQEIGGNFREITIASINRKREIISKFNLIAQNIIDEFEDFAIAYEIMKKELNKYDDIEAIYLIDAATSKQIHDTVIINNINGHFKPSKNGEEHYLKEYYYITLESKQGIFLSHKYISYATGNICKTFAKKFVLNNKSYILCLDLVLKKGI